MSDYKHIEELIEKFRKEKYNIINYKTFTHEDVLKMTEQEVIDLHNRWGEEYKENKKHIEECHLLLKELLKEVECFLKIFIGDVMFVNNKIKRKNVIAKILQDYTVPSLKEIPYYKQINSCNGVNVIEYWRANKVKEKLDSKKSERVNKEFIKAVQIATSQLPLPKGRGL